MNNKLIEVQNILNNCILIDNYNKIKEFKQIYKIELKNFIYIDDKNIIINFKNKYIKYIGFNNILNNGGIFYKTEYINNILYIYLINKNKKIWKINFDQNYIFYIDKINSNNDLKRNVFDIFIKKYENN